MSFPPLSQSCHVNRHFAAAWLATDEGTVTRLVADIQELRWAAFAVSHSTASASAPAAAHRIDSLQGTVPKPWTWNGLCTP